MAHVRKRSGGRRNSFSGDGQSRKRRVGFEAADDLHPHGDGSVPLPGNNLQVTGADDAAEVDGALR